ncbi:hypothetical protein ACFQPF_14860 [Fictibacillus iocasae]|uniref:DUF4397 domain-containing protein n=1 Tax=Fictibacillus iocasae TaxID=2715437 RepID=A0ABW2NQY7_9BACL
MAVFSTGPIENKEADGLRETVRVVVRIVNQSSFYAAARVDGYVLKGTRELYAVESFSIGPQESITKEYFAELDGYEFVVQTSGEGAEDLEVSVWGKNAANLLTASHRLVTEENRQQAGNSPDNPQFVEVVNNSAENPVTVRVLNSFEDPSVGVTQSTAAARSGRFFALSTSQIQLFGNGFAAIEILNPSDSPDTLSIERVSAGTAQNTIIALYFDATLVVGGTPIVPVNSVAGYPRPSNTECRFTVTTTDPITEGQLINTFVQSGIGGIEIIDYEGRFIVPPGNNFFILLTNSSGGVSNASVNVTWSEFPLALPPFP